MARLSISAQVEYGGLVDVGTLAWVRLLRIKGPSRDWPGVQLGRWLIAPAGVPEVSTTVAALVVQGQEYRECGPVVMVAHWAVYAVNEFLISWSVSRAINRRPRRAFATARAERFLLERISDDL